MHRGAIGRPREESVRQVQQHEESVRDFASYVPIGHAVEKLRTWNNQGAELIYISSHKRLEHVEQDQVVLKTYHFPTGQVTFRAAQETYQDVAERVMPDILIEDDCESIGGEQETIYPYLRPGIRVYIRSIIVREFEGIDHLPDNLTDLKNKVHNFR